MICIQRENLTTSNPSTNVLSTSDVKSSADAAALCNISKLERDIC